MNTGAGNVAIGREALTNNTTGSFNVGIRGGGNLTTGIFNIDIANDGVADESNTTRIGILQTNCYISGIFDSVINENSFFVGVDDTGKLGDTVGLARKLRIKDVAESLKKVAELEATVAALTAQLKEQAAQIQKVSVDLEMSKPATSVVLNNP